jgi:hypothetical protein
MTEQQKWDMILQAGTIVGTFLKYPTKDWFELAQALSRNKDFSYDEHLLLLAKMREMLDLKISETCHR